jgi:hypothetical protein
MNLEVARLRSGWRVVNHCCRAGRQQVAQLRYSGGFEQRGPPVKPLNKRDMARLERELVVCLTEACETAKAEIVGFSWLTHRLAPEDFPASLRITWVFEREADKAAAVAGDAKVRMLALTGLALEQAGIQLDHPAWHVRFDSEEACQQSHGGDWSKRLMGR